MKNIPTTRAMLRKPNMIFILKDFTVNWTLTIIYFVRIALNNTEKQKKKDQDQVYTLFTVYNYLNFHLTSW